MAQQGQQGGGGQGGGGNESLDFLWLVVIIVVGVLALWHFYREGITNFVFFVRLYEIKAIRAVMDIWETVLAFFTLKAPDISMLNEWERYIQSKPSNVPIGILEGVSREVGRYLSYPVAVILTLLGLIIYRKHIILKFKTIFSMATLKKAELSVWPQSKPTLGKNLVKEDLKKGPWSMAMTPVVFCEQHKIIQSIQKEGKSVGKLIRGPAYRVFALQTGRLWPGLNGVKMHVKALFAIFAAKANHDTDLADKLLGQISSSSEGKFNYSGVDAALSKYYSSKVVQQVIAQHAYLLTIMASMLELARSDGVLASAEFLWLKPIDRPLWYMLNSVGRRVAVPEIAGAFAHWLAEKELKTSIRTPMVDSAVKAMEIELSNTLYESEKKEEE